MKNINSNKDSTFSTAGREYKSVLIWVCKPSNDLTSLNNLGILKTLIILAI